ncbi:metal-dependent hydrolase [Bacillus phage Izhevsk]|uniref:MBL-fold metallohydrolase superfamily protein, putative RNaseZ-like tRNA maturase n=1 Tax=Bacillus phage Izhevsk TaxID=2724322 RepID=A0A6H0X690_9CAUD|nr:metal-dependent hydrolase [Bacillus phage Izhevsk]QIW89825.1 MBL-fold metallohydrolase superfamily protein, putative RNaseZ-like tRNA maturase [Bacillus phage Izhevsk]
MFEFIGTGSAFNTSLGNNGAFIKQGNKFFMIDCGSATFHRIMEANLLEGVEEIYVLITHTHPDHIGSLGDLIFYGYYSMGNVMEKNVTVLAPDNLEIALILSYMGVDTDTYYLKDFPENSINYIEDFEILMMAVHTKHVKELDCYGYLFDYKGLKIYYSGDANIIPTPILNMFNDGGIHILYQDTCGADYEGNVHLSLKKLDELIAEGKELRKRVYCMHLDEKFDEIEAISLGFNVVKGVL